VKVGLYEYTNIEGGKKVQCTRKWSFRNYVSL